MAELYALPDGWVWKEFSKVFNTPTSKPYQIQKTEYLENGLLPIIDQGKEFIIGYTNLVEKKYSNESNCIIFGDHTRQIKYVDFDFVIGADGTKILKEKDKNKYDLKFLYFQFLSKEIESLGYSRHFKLVKEMFFAIPSLDEQKRIVAKLDILFGKIDKAIALHQKNIDEANVFMASVLNDVFAELEEKYEKKQLNEIVIFGGKNISTLEYPNLIYFSLEDVEAQTGRILNYKTVNESGVKGTAVRFDENVVLYSKLRPYLNKVIVPNLEGCSTTELVVLKPKDKLDKYFLASYLRSSNIVNFLNNDSMGAKMPRTNMKTFRNLEISFPPYETQQKTVSYLDEISQKIEKTKQIQKEKMQSLKALKASILDQAFKGEL